ncbi:neuronal acetylcholine receptor subunit beta-3-like [Argopecten irradians]|uniref:neuronal acetylcholine receptor subunit beta-3-like n=1 Tax=Argopecten irradians TaxID=31199 RepID=UPI00372189C3
MSLISTFGGFIIISLLQSCSGSEFNNTRLLTDLLQGYQKWSRPGNNYSVPLDVYVEFHLLSIRDFVQLTNKFAITGVFELSWTDERISWNPNDYGGIDRVNIPQDVVWKPELINTKPFTAVQAIGIPTFGITYFSDGWAVWTPGDNYDTPCEADVTYYPFDNQSCTFRFSDWTQIPGSIRFVAPSSQIGLGLYVINPMWDVTNTMISLQKDEFGHFIFFGIHFKRLNGFYVLNLIMPLCLISFVNIFVFVLPAESGERIGFSITVFLALSVLLTIMSENLPQTSRPHISIVCYMIFFQTTISIFILLATILSLRFYFASESESVPKHWQRFTQLSNLGWLCKKRTKRQISNETTESKPVALGSKELFAVDLDDNVEPQNKTNMTEEAHQARKDHQIMYKHITWREVGGAVDKTCTVVFSFMNVLNIAVFFFTMQM